MITTTSLLAFLAVACDSSGKKDQQPDDPGQMNQPEPVDPIPAAPSAKGPPPISGGTLLLMPDGKTAVASDPDRDSIYVVDLLSRKLTATIALEANDEPGRLVHDGTGRVHVALRRGGALATIDTATGTLLARRTICAAPRGVAFDGVKNLIHVACASGELVSIAPMGETPTRTLSLGRDLRDVRVSGDNLLVSSFRQAELIVLDSVGTEKNRMRPNTTAAAFGFRGKETAGLKASPAVAWRMIAGPRGETVVLHQRGVDQPLSTEPGGYTSQACAGIVETAVTEYETVDASAAVVRSGRALQGTVLGVDMALSPGGKQLAVVAAGNTGSRQLLFYDMESATNPPPDNMVDPCVGGSEIPMDEGAGDTGDMTGPLPEPIEYRPPNGQVTSVAFDLRGNIIVQSRQPATLQILTQRADPIVLSLEIKADPGHQVFHAATTGLVACASCHPEGGEDSRIWQFNSVGLRRTQSLRGGIMDTAPFHWSGELASLNHLMTDVFQGRMSGTPLQKPQLDALKAWIDGIPSVAIAGLAVDSVAHGKDIFNSARANCTACHKGADFSDGKAYDVGTGGLFQTPQLHSLAMRAPYMHNGCAKTLADRFTAGCGGDSRHGNTASLDKQELADLITYLETL